MATSAPEVVNDGFRDASDKAIADCQQALHMALDVKGHGVDVTDQQQDVATLAKDCQKLTSAASNAGLIDALTTAFDNKLKESEQRVKAHVDAKVAAEMKESEQRMKAHVDVKFAEIKEEFSSALAHAGYNGMARLSNAAAPTDAPLTKLKKEAGCNAGAVPPSPPFPASKAALFTNTTAEQVNQLEEFYGIQFKAAAAEAGRATRTNDLQQRRQQLASFLGVR